MGYPIREEAEEPLLHTSSVVPSSAPPSRSPSPIPLPKKEEVKLNLVQMLHQIPSHTDVEFEPLNMAEPFPASAHIPSDTDILSAYGIFSLFISKDSIAQLSVNTNKYAQMKNAGDTGRAWHDTTPADIIIFLGVLIYMGVHISPRDEDY